MPTPQHPIDPDVKLPEAVRRAAARVEEIYNTPPQDPGAPEANQQASNGAGEATENTSEEGAGEQQQDNTQNRAEPTRVASVATERANARRERARAASLAREHAAEPEAAPSTGEAQPQEHTQERAPERQPERQPEHQPERQEETWERKYNAMKGRFDQANNQLQNLTQQVAGLQNVITTLQQPQALQEQTSSQQVESMITQEEREQYGDEFLGVVAKKAHEIVGSLKRELEDKIKRLDSQLENVGQQVEFSTKEKMFTTLDNQIPDWREVNNDPNFVQWLQLPDTYSGAIRHNLLREAFNRNDAGRVAAFFNGFLAEEAATAPQGQPRSQGAPSQVTNGGGTQQTPKTSLETLAAPGRAKSAAAQAPAEKPIFTGAQIAAFYTAVAAGKYEGRGKEKDKLEAQIFSAQQEGRIRN